MEYDELSAGLAAWAAEAEGVLGLVTVCSSGDTSQADAGAVPSPSGRSAPPRSVVDA